MLDFTEVEPIHNAFSPMVRRQSFDLSDLAVVTGIQAVVFGKPVALLPAVVASRMQCGCLIARSSDGLVDSHSLRGKRIGVRSYTLTIGMWVRAACGRTIIWPRTMCIGSRMTIRTSKNILIHHARSVSTRARAFRHSFATATSTQPCSATEIDPVLWTP